MHMIACLKLVADPDIVTFDVVKNELTALYPVMDPIGYHVLEAGLQLREANGGRLTAVCLGDATAEAILHYALHQGADAAIRFSPGGPAETDTWARARAIAKGLSSTSYDLILTGAASAGGLRRTVPQAIAGATRGKQVAGLLPGSRRVITTAGRASKANPATSEQELQGLRDATA